MMKRSEWSWVALLLCCVGLAQAALIDEAQVVSASESLATTVPQAKTLSIPTTGTYTLKLTDLGAEPDPDLGTPFSSLSVVISQGAQRIKYLAVPAAAATITGSVVLSAGQYQVQVLGVTAGASLYGVELKNDSNVLVWSDAGAINAPSATSFTESQQALNLTVGETYTVTLTDRVFPVALESLELIVTEGATQAGNCNLLAAGTCSFVAIASSALLTVLASEATDSAGLYSVKVTNSAGGTVYGATLPVGDMPAPVSISLPATDTNYSLNSFDFGGAAPLPTPLTAFKLALAQGAEVPVTQVTIGNVPSFSASGGAASLYVIATPVANSAGLYSVQIKRGATPVYSQVNSVEDSSSTNLEGYVFTANLPAAGSYTLQLRDFAFPQAFALLKARLVQDGAILGNEMSAAGTVNSLTISNAAAGEISITVLATPGNNTEGLGLFGVGLTASGATDSTIEPIFEQNQGVGLNIRSNVVNIVTAGRYALSVTDFVAPQALDQLQIAITRGSRLAEGAIFGGGTIPFEASPGDYTLSFVTKAKASASFGMYGVNLIAAPTVTLAPSAASIASGGSTELAWSSTNADSCAASDGWSGSKASAGSSLVGPLTTATTFTLTCTNVAGSTAQSVTVAVQSPTSKQGGGGSISLYLLLALGLLGALRPGTGRMSMSR